MDSLGHLLSEWESIRGAYDPDAPEGDDNVTAAEVMEIGDELAEGVQALVDLLGGAL